MNELSARALETARSRGATYADVRFVRAQRESIQLKNGTVEALSMGEEHGFGVRVIADGAWGFASSSILTADEVDRVAALAVQIARASARVARAPVNLGPPLREQVRRLNVFCRGYDVEPSCTSAETAEPRHA